MAALADGALVAVAGRFVHRLDPETLAVQHARELPAARPHNSFAVLPDGTLALKDLDLDLRAPATVRALDPVTLEDRDVLELPEPVVARLSAGAVACMPWASTAYTGCAGRPAGLRSTGTGRRATATVPARAMAGTP